MQLAIAWGRPIEYVESLPSSVIAEFKALNIISPYTPEAQAHREGLIATLLYNKGCSKKTQMKTIPDLFPYLSRGTPDWLEDERVKKAKSIFKSIALQRGNPELYESSMNELVTKVKEEIEIMEGMDEPDRHTINELQKIIGEDYGKDL